MRIPDSLASLADEGIIEEVLRPLMSGKEAQIYLLRSGGEQRVAKVYKASHERTFRQRSEYTEGRKVRNSRDQRAMSKRTKHGREQDEAAWRAAEVDMIYRLHAAGVRVPTPYQFIDGVLIMELISDGEGNPAPRLGDVELDRESALSIYDQLLREVVRMLCAGVVHGDLSDFNVLMAPDGPVIIDFPQAVNASSNANARKLLLRDVDNLHRFLLRFVPERRPLPYAEEMWQLYQRGELTPDVRLSGRFRSTETRVNTDSVLGLIADAERDERRRRANLGMSMRGTAEPDRTAERGQAQGRPARMNPNAGPQTRSDAGSPARGPAGLQPPARVNGGSGSSAHSDPNRRSRHAHASAAGRGAVQQGPAAGRGGVQHGSAAGRGGVQQGPAAGRGAVQSGGRGAVQPIVQNRRPLPLDPRSVNVRSHAQGGSAPRHGVQTNTRSVHLERTPAQSAGRVDGQVERVNGERADGQVGDQEPLKTRKRRRRRRRKGGAAASGPDAQAAQPPATDRARNDAR